MTARDAVPELPALTLPQMLARHARLQPDAVAIRQKRFGIWQPFTWAQYHRRARRVALGLRALGLAGRGHVGVISENRIEWVLAQLGCGLAGGVAVGVYPTSPNPEVAYVLGHADVEIVVCEDQEQTDKVLQAWPALPRLRVVVVMETKGLRAAPAEYRDRVIAFSGLEALGERHEATQGAALDAALAGQRLDELALMIYTSGSTGKPKGAMIGYDNLRAIVPGMVERLGLDRHGSHLSYLPLCHVAEQMLTVFAPLYLGSTVSFGESIRTVQDDLRDLAPTLFLGVPRIWEKLHASILVRMQDSGRLRRALFARALAACAPFAEKSARRRSPRERAVFCLWYLLVFRALQNYIGLRRARVALTGAAPIPPAVMRFFRTLGVPLIEVYGLTESSGMVLGQRLDDVRLGSVGQPILGVEHRIGEQGELLVRGGMVFRGYYKNPQASAEAIRDGWLHTGDVVREDGGALAIVDRLKDIMITAGGKNLTPSEIESAMKASPFIKECVVVADGRRYATALVQIDAETVGKWAESRRIAFTHFRSLVETPAVRELIQQEIDRGNASLAPVAQVKRFHLLAKELDHDDGEVTATMKVRRGSIHQAYAREIESLYG